MSELPNGPPLDEIQFRGIVPESGLHDNSILWYFRDSPFYDKESNNEIMALQANYNADIARDLGMRSTYEARLKTMAGTEFLVGQEPSETAPGTGTGVWVINRQNRRKRKDMEDEVNKVASYFVVGENIYMAPSVADVMSSRIATISSTINKAMTEATELQTWSSSRGRIYANPTARAKGLLESKEATPLPAAPGTDAPTTTKPLNRAALDARLAEESLAIHMRYGNEYMDLNPITGQPGSFHLSSTGRKDAGRNLLSVPASANEAQVVAPLNLKDAALPSLDTKATAAENPLARKDTKSPRSGAPKPKRRKSKGGTATPTASAPNTPTPRG